MKTIKQLEFYFPPPQDKAKKDCQAVQVQTDLIDVAHSLRPAGSKQAAINEFLLFGIAVYKETIEGGKENG